MQSANLRCVLWAQLAQRRERDQGIVSRCAQQVRRLCDPISWEPGLVYRAEMQAHLSQGSRGLHARLPRRHPRADPAACRTVANAAAPRRRAFSPDGWVLTGMLLLTCPKSQLLAGRSLRLGALDRRRAQ